MAKSLLFWMSVLLLAACKPDRASPETVSNKSQDPRLLSEGIISTDLYERDLALSPDGNTLIYTLADARQNRRVLVAMARRNGEWEPGRILPFSGRFQDIEPFFSPKGESLLFASNRPVNGDSTRKDFNIWKVPFSNGNWGKPYPLDTLINSRGDEFFPAVTESGNLYFTATREGGIGLEDIYRSVFTSDGYLPPKVLDSTINTATYEFNAYVSPKENLLIFSSYGRADGLGGGDLYYSQKGSDGGWSEAVHLESPVNSKWLDYSPFWDTKNKVLYFSSERIVQGKDTLGSIQSLREFAQQPENGLGNIYFISWNPFQ
jgi:Tol biopolymer transport system component